MGWDLKCSRPRCGQMTWAANIVDLVADHRDAHGWFLCSCGAHASVERKFALQEPGEEWEPHLRGIVPLGSAGEIYQPFVFLVSYGATDPVVDVWFSYYKDMRPSGGRLKFGYGPGGPPVLGKEQILDLVSALIRRNVLTADEVTAAVARAETP